MSYWRCRIGLAERFVGNSRERREVLQLHIPIVGLGFRPMASFCSGKEPHGGLGLRCRGLENAAGVPWLPWGACFGVGISRMS